MSLEVAIEKLKEFYAEALKTSWVRHPVAWALYQTWKESMEKAAKEVSRV